MKISKKRSVPPYYRSGRYPSSVHCIGAETPSLLHLEVPATTVAAVYKERWQIELLFKALKHNLCIKTFVGTTANALKTQIWTALIALLAVKFLQLQARFPGACRG